MVERKSLMLKPNQNNICPFLWCAFDTERGDEWSLRAFASTSRDKKLAFRAVKKGPFISPLLKITTLFLNQKDNSKCVRKLV